MTNSIEQKTNFSLEKYSFLFPNRFNLNSFLVSPRIPFYYGLCGGMCFTALDIYYQKKQAPNFKNPNNLPKSLRSYLIKRQLHSTGFRSLLKLFQSLFQPTTKLTNNSINQELPRILASLNAGYPVPIILVRSTKLKKPTNNHQILIIGYKINNAITELQSYDPNYPGYLTSVRISQQESEYSEILQSTGENVRGFFMNYYKRKIPKNIYQKQELVF